MHTFAGWWKSSGETRRIKKKRIQKTPTIPRLRLGTTKKNLLLKIVQLGRNPLHTEPVLQLVDQESQRITEATREHYLHISPYRLHYMDAVFSMVCKTYGRQPWRSYGKFECEFGFLVNVHECHSSSSSSSRKRLWHEFENGKQRDSFSRKQKSWSVVRHWHKPDQVTRFQGGYRQAYCTVELSMCQCQSVCLLWLCALLGKTDKQSCWIPEANSMVFRQRFTSANWITSLDPVIRYSVVTVPWREDNKGGGKTTTHFNGGTQNIELLLQMVISVNQLSLYGAAVDMIEETPVGRRAPGNPVASGQLDKPEILTQPPLAEMPLKSDRETCYKNMRTISVTVSRQEVIQTVLRSRFEISRSWICSSITKQKSKSIFVPRIHVASRSKKELK